MSENKELNKKKKRVWKGIFLLLLFILILILLIPFIIHIKPVQNWLVSKVTNKLEQKSHSTVDLEEVDFSIYKGLVLRNLYISEKDAPQDTLFYLGEFSTSLEQNLLSVLKNRLALDKIVLADANLNIIKRKGAEQSNLEEFLSSLKSESGQNAKTKESISLGLKSLNVERVSLNIEDENSGSQTSVNVAEAYLSINELNLTQRHYLFNELLISNPVVKIISPVNKSEKKGKASVEAKPDTAKALVFELKHLEISNGNFERIGQSISKIKSTGFDINNLLVSEVNLNADSTFISLPINVKSQIRALSLKERNGFMLKQVQVNQLRINDKLFALEDFYLETGNSTLGRNVVLSYDAFNSFNNFAEAIDIEADFKKAKLSFLDMAYFFPELKSSSFVKKNKSRWLSLDGDLYGTVDDLESDNLNLSFGNKVNLNGAVSTYNLTKSDKALISLHVESFSTSLSNLRDIIPGFSPPEQFYKLDPITFTGDIDGFFRDFVLYGELNSPLGGVTLDTRLDLKNGIDEAKYYGEISLEDFDLYKWSDNEDLGSATLYAKIEDGKGLTLDNLDAKLSTELKSFVYKGYEYKDINLSGQFEKNLFDGSLESDDPNAALSFEGKINIKNGQIDSDFAAEIQNINLRALNLSKDFGDIKGNVVLNFAGSAKKDLVGAASIRDLSLNFKDKDFVFDSLFLSSSPSINGLRNVIISSDLINGSMSGQFNFNDVLPHLYQHLHQVHPSWSEFVNLPRPTKLSKDITLRYKLAINDTKDYLELASIQDLRLKEINISGRIDSKQKEYKNILKADTVYYKDLVFDGLDLSLSENQQEGIDRLSLEGFKVGALEFKPLSLAAKIIKDEVELHLQTTELLDSVEVLDLKLNAVSDGNKILASFSDQQLKMFSSIWDIEPKNRIEYKKGSLQLSDLRLNDGFRSINIDDINERGIKASLNNFDFLLINSIIAYDKIEFSGPGNLSISKEDIFKQSSMLLDLFIPEFMLNKVDYGSLQVTAEDNSSDTIVALVNLQRKDGMQLKLDAGYQKKDKALYGNILGNKLPMETFEFIIDDGISGTDGDAYVKASVSGVLPEILIDGEAYVTNGTTTIDYLGAPLYLGEERFTVTHKAIDLTGTTLKDKLGNTATMSGGLVHELFTDFESALTMESDYFLALDTDALDNPSYYGTGIGDITVEFSGPFSSTDILVNATTGPGTVLNIPVGDIYEDVDESFIKVVDRNAMFTEIKDSIIYRAPTLEGVDVEMNLSITQDAKVNIIFDESTNDIIRGIGGGNMRIIMARSGEFNIFGDYVIEQGEYLFTYFGGIISKPFTVKQGGVITWTGDPINANLNLEATYEKLRTPMNIFLAEYIVGQNANSQAVAKQRTDIDLKMFLTGTLYEPEVNFDIQFPELQGELKTLAESKMRILRDNEADLNEQVAGLIMFGSFLPSSSLGSTVGSASGLARTGYNTLSEMVSNQLSYVLSGFLQEALNENGFVSGIDFDIGFNKDAEISQQLGPGGPGPNSGSSNSSIIPDEIEVHLKPRFQNDRWEIDYGTSYVNNNVTTSGNAYVIHDFVISFFLTEDRRLKLRAYGKWDRDLNNDPDQKYGVGFNYQKEFGNLVDFKKQLIDDFAKMKSKDEGE